MQIQEIITIDNEIQFGKPTFTGTRVPIESLFWHLEAGISLDDFLNDFPSVKREQAIALLELAQSTFSKPQIYKFYETAA